MFFLFQRGYFHVPAVSFRGCTFFVWIVIFQQTDSRLSRSKLQGNPRDEETMVALQISSLADSGNHGQSAAAFLWFRIDFKLSWTTGVLHGCYLLFRYDGGAIFRDRQ